MKLAMMNSPSVFGPVGPVPHAGTEKAATEE